MPHTHTLAPLPLSPPPLPLLFLTIDALEDIAVLIGVRLERLVHVGLCLEVRQHLCCAPFRDVRARQIVVRRFPWRGMEVGYGSRRVRSWSAGVCVLGARVMERIGEDGS